MPIDTPTEPVEPQVDEPQDIEEPAKGDDGRAMETNGRTDASPDPEDFKIDVQPPKGLEEEHKELQKQFRDAWLKKNSENAEKLKASEAARQHIAEELERRQKAFDELALKGNPVQVKQPEPEPLPEFQDMGQLTRYVEERAALKAEAALQARMTQYEQRKAYEDRWVSGWNSVLEKDKTAHLFTDLAKNELMNPKSQYLKIYNGQNETEVLQKTVDGIRNVYEKFTESVKQQTIADMKRKTTTVTEKPVRSMTVSKSPHEMTKAEILAEMKAELGPS